MTPEAQRIAIAEACGWIKVGSRDQIIGQRPGTPMFSSYAEALPDYLTDLNAMHEAEKTLTHDELTRYEEAVFRSVVKAGGNWRPTVCATAAQRAKAFLRTIGKWTTQDTQQVTTQVL